MTQHDLKGVSIYICSSLLTQAYTFKISDTQDIDTVGLREKA